MNAIKQVFQNETLMDTHRIFLISPNAKMTDNIRCLDTQATQLWQINGHKPQETGGLLLQETLGP